jgi:hypothetical protein
LFGLTPKKYQSGEKDITVDHEQKRELGGVTITRGDLTSPGPLQKGAYL